MLHFWLAKGSKRPLDKISQSERAHALLIDAAAHHHAVL